MTTLVLPGYSVKNKEWLEETAKNLKVDGQIRPVYWDHWEDESQKFNPKEKAIMAARHVRGDKINIVAKSIGTLVAALIVKQIPDQIEKVILCGIPTGDLRSDEEVEIIRSIQAKNLIVFQNSEDPHGSYEKIVKMFPNFKVVKKEASNHEYFYFEDFNKYLS